MKYPFKFVFPKRIPAFLLYVHKKNKKCPNYSIYYRKRWHIETAFRDAKQHFGFDDYRLKSRKSINRFVQLSFVAASLTKLLFTPRDGTAEEISAQVVCDQLGIHWYHPKRLTQGLRVVYLRWQLYRAVFSAIYSEKTNSQKIHTDFHKETALPADNAA